MNSGGYICRDAKRRGIYLALFTDPEGDICLSIYQISWIIMKKVTIFVLLIFGVSKIPTHYLKKALVT